MILSHPKDLSKLTPKKEPEFKEVVQEVASEVIEAEEVTEATEAVEAVVDVEALKAVIDLHTQVEAKEEKGISKEVTTLRAVIEAEVAEVLTEAGAEVRAEAVAEANLTSTGLKLLAKVKLLTRVK